MVELNQWHRGRLIDHIQLVVRDLEASRRFYGAVLEVLGVPLVAGEGYFYADELFVSPGEPLTGRAHIAFQAPDHETVQRFYASALAAGGRDNGAPGLRSYHPGYYAAFVLDPEGNNIEAVCHGPATRSAPSVVLTDAS
ncbi:VOC family protein [Ancylobacter sp. MQZ15Z-1]|uniref:VOC family protein n=1 Tax=Ancylobacter mangrovi TaxID=2972472 RepID=A0A9X2T0I8_9HYPH|nr:VOC family protein [Ancylobacter mangrovi]MCS0493642.1 VOC family protein [Ancylobacter mangrovi]